MILASLVIEKPPLEWAGFVDAIGSWLQDAGVYAFLWLLLLGLSYRLVPEFRHRTPWSRMHQVMLGFAAASLACLIVFLILLMSQGRIEDVNAPKLTDVAQAKNYHPMTYRPSQKLFFSLAGLFALAGCVVPLMRDLWERRVVGRRIWAIARLSIKEAWSRGIVWVCLLIPLLYLYADWYISAKPEDQLRNRVAIAYFSMSILFVLTAVLLGAFSIPADIRSQNIFTIVTKPVERYEIVLGRFVGYATLLLAEVLVLTGISYVYVTRGLTDQAREESYHARVPLFGRELFFHNTGKRTEGENVGREWNYRSYITGIHPQSPNRRVQFAIWSFDDLPASLADREQDVRLEFGFDIFRTTTGLEGKDVICTFTIARGDLTPEQVEELVKPTGKLSTETNKRLTEKRKQNEATGKVGDELKELNDKSRREVAEALFQELGVYQIEAVGVTDYHTQVEMVPPWVFKTLLASAKDRDRTPGPDGKPPPAMLIFLNVAEHDRFSQMQMVGVAQADLYLLVGDRPFWQNFLKGSVCIYLVSCLVLGIAVVASTYFSGVVSLLLTALLCIGGLFLPFIRSVAEGRSDAGGPGEAFYRLFNKQPGAAPLDRQSATVDVLLRTDAVYRWLLNLVTNLIPDVSQFYRNDYVANGFDITWGTLLFLNTVLPALGYLLPWGVLAYFLMKSREIANP